MRIALGQLLSGPDPAENLEQVRVQTAVAAADGAELVVFPEATMRAFGTALHPVAEPVDGPWGCALAAVAEEHQVVVVAGMFTPAEDGRVHNTLRIVGPGLEARYDKVHLFDAFGFAESETVAPGAATVVLSVGVTPIGFATCYDLRFPGLFLTLADRGASVICVPASWGAGPGKLDQWRLLLRARALDTTTYVVGVGQANPTSVGRSTSGRAPTGVGHSAVVAPDGAVLAELGPEPDLLVADLDLAVLDRVRSAIPVLANRRI